MPATSSGLSTRSSVLPAGGVAPFDGGYAIGNITAALATMLRPPPDCSVVSPIAECDNPKRWPISCVRIDCASNLLTSPGVPVDQVNWAAEFNQMCDAIGSPDALNSHVVCPSTRSSSGCGPNP